VESVDKLEKQKKGVIQKLEGARQYLADTQRELEEVQRKINVHRPLTITDHFRIRYLERVYGINLEDLDKEILERFSGVHLIARLSTKDTLYTSDGLSVGVKNNTLITVYSKKLDKSN
jgi:hypothetical protein